MKTLKRRALLGLLLGLVRPGCRRTSAGLAENRFKHHSLGLSVCVADVSAVVTLLLPS
ncbi:MAG TPA: hypothetical protein VNW71_01330 [Thermoanaerobaculia bacterium]|nr:hypothetical protein [Thermoanaerobaculia bacterium]